MVSAQEKGRAIIFAYPSFGWFWCARIVSGLAFQIAAAAVGWQIYALTHSTFELGMVGLVQFLPIVLLTLIAGHVVDRYDRRLIYGLSLAIQAAAAAFLALGSGGHWLGVTGIFIAAALFGAGRAFQGPGGQALLPTLVPAPEVPNAIAWSMGSFQTASIVGPAFGGLLYAIAPAVPYALAGLLALGGCGLMALIQQERPVKPREPSTADSMFSGIHFIRRKPVILGSISLDLFAVLLGGATALLPAFARDILHVGPWGFGWLRAGPAVGSLVMSFVLVRHPPRRQVGRKMFAAVAIFGAATILFGVSAYYPLSLAALIVLGAADTISVIVRQSLVQLETPNEMRGRVGAVNSLFIGTSNQLGEFESGVTASLLGTVGATVAGGVGTLIIVLLWMRWFPELAAFDSFVPKAAGAHGPDALRAATGKST
ncbi:MAG TPA: MFS transporter [Opitutaceae bacterium]|jgi:MFS family permease|nr:MFS transporter [Opitutaceae bacterium]